MHRKMVSERYTRANGYEADCDVIYGDTDSVMVHFRVADTARAMELGKQAAEYVSATFVRPIKLEFEKVTPRLPPATKRVSLICNQRYASHQESWARRTGCPFIALLNNGIPLNMPCLLSTQVYNPYLLINKKRYAGLLWTSPIHWDKMDTKVCPPPGGLPAGHVCILH